MRFTPQLDHEVSLREETSDHQTWIDAFEQGHHVPPDIEPEFVLDLGANIGLTAAHYAALWPKAKVVAVEMDEEHAALCQQNFGGLVVNVAVGAYTGSGSYAREGWQARYSLLRPGDTFVRVLTITEILDDCLPEADKVFCKMDIEGSEWEIFKEGIDDRIKWLLVEVHRIPLPHPRILRAMGYLHKLGFEVSHLIREPSILWATR